MERKKGGNQKLRVTPLKRILLQFVWWQQKHTLLADSLTPNTLPLASSSSIGRSVRTRNRIPNAGISSWTCLCELNFHFLEHITYTNTHKPFGCSAFGLPFSSMECFKRFLYTSSNHLILSPGAFFFSLPLSLSASIGNSLSGFNINTRLQMI